MAAPPFPPLDPEALTATYREELRLLVDVLAHVYELFQRIDGRSMGGMNRVEFYFCMQLTKAFKTTQAIRSLFCSGYAEDAEALLRLVVDQGIIAKWIAAGDADAKVQAYALYLRETRSRDLELARKFIPSVPLDPAIQAEIDRDIAEYRTRDKCERWRRLTGDPAEIAAEAGVPGSYAVYVRGTDLIHSNPQVEALYVREADGEVYFNAIPCQPKNGWAVVLAAKHLLWVASGLDAAFGLGQGARLAELEAAVDRYAPPDPPHGAA